MEREALVVGINNYPFLKKNLTGSAKDAEAIAKILEKFGNFRVTRLIDSEQDGASSGDGIKTENLQQAIIELFNPPEQDIPKTALLFFAGHGLYKKELEENFFLATSSTYKHNSNVPEKSHWGIPLTWLRIQLKKSPVREQIILLDCCYSGGFFKEDIPVQEGIKQCLISASREYQESYEQRGGHGIFTEALLKGLDPNNKINSWVTNHDLKKFLDEYLYNKSQRHICVNSEEAIILTDKNYPLLKENVSKSVNRCPYKSLKYFQQNDGIFFHGRTTLTYELINKVCKENFVFVLGSSGSGKSSLLRAGLLYQLQRGQELEVSIEQKKILNLSETEVEKLKTKLLELKTDRWKYYEPFTPKDKPLESLKNAISKDLSLPLDSNVENWVQELTGLINSLEVERVVLVVDQFEECFTMCQDTQERKQFFKCLVDTVQATNNKLCLVLGMRIDFMGKILEYEELANKIRLQQHQMMVVSMNETEIKEAIQKPAVLIGLGVRNDLIEMIARDVLESPGSLPILQYTLTELYEVAKRETTDFLTLDTYKQLGGIKEILSKRANEVYESLPEEQQCVAKRIFLELIQVSEVSDTRRRVFLEDLQNDKHPLDILNKVTETLAKERLITKDKDTSTNLNEQGKIQLDIVHESLIRHWEMLKEWVNEYRYDLGIQRKIEARAKEWENKSKKEDQGLLLQGEPLEEAEKYLNKYREMGFVATITEEYIKRSKAVQESSEKERREKDETHKAELENERINTKLQKKSNEVLNLLRDSSGPDQLKQALAQAIATIGLNLNQLPEEAASSVENLAKHPGKILGIVQSSLNQAMTKARVPNTCEGHESFVNAVAFSPNGKMIVSGSSDLTLRLWDINGNIIGEPWCGHKDVVLSVAFSPDGQTVVSSSNDKTIRLWDINGKPIGQPWDEHKSKIQSVAFSPDGQMIVGGGDDGTLRLWDINGNIIGEPWCGHKDVVLSVAFSPDGQTVVSSSNDKTIRLWDINGKPIGQPWDEHKSKIQSVAFSPDGQMIVSGGDDNMVRLWEINGKSIGEPQRGDHSFVNSIAFSPDGQKIVLGCENSNIWLWDDFRDGDPIKQLLNGHKGIIRSVAFSPDGQTVVSGGGELVCLWDIRDNFIGQFPCKHEDAVNAVAFSPDGEKIVSGCGDGTLCLWDINGKSIGEPWDEHRGAVNAVAFSPILNNQRIVSGGDDGTLRLWDINGKSIGEPWCKHQGAVKAVAFSPDGEKIISGCAGGKLCLWNIDGSLIGQPWVDNMTKVFNAVAFSPDGEKIISGNDNQEVLLWSIDGKISTRLWYGYEDEGAVNAVAFSPDGQMIFCGSTDSTLYVWTKMNGKYVRSYKDSVITIPDNTENAVNAIAFSPDGQMILSASSDGDGSRLRLWDIDGKPIGEPLQGHKDSVKAVAFSPDGKTIVSASNDGQLCLWRGGWQAWLEICGQRLLPLVLKDQTNNIFEESFEVCRKYKIWSNTDIGKILKMQGDEFDFKKRQEDLREALNEVINKYKEALKYDPNLDLNPQDEAQRRVAPFWFKEGVTLAQKGKIEEAVRLCTEAQKFDPTMKVATEDWCNFGWYGIVHGCAAEYPEIMAACEKAVESEPNNEDFLIDSLDNRGLCRALNGNLQGAIEDFERVIALADYENFKLKRQGFKLKRQGWFDALSAGENPFTPEEIEKLKGKNVN